MSPDDALLEYRVKQLEQRCDGFAQADRTIGEAIVGMRTDIRDVSRDVKEIKDTQQEHRRQGSFQLTRLQTWAAVSAVLVAFGFNFYFAARGR